MIQFKDESLFCVIPLQLALRSSIGEPKVLSLLLPVSQDVTFRKLPLSSILGLMLSVARFKGSLKLWAETHRTKRLKFVKDEPLANL
jgi:hypothetical protein